MSRALEQPLPSARPTARDADESVAVRPRRPAWHRALVGVGRVLGLGQSTSLARRFMLASLLVLTLGGLIVGWYIGGQLERGIIDRTASITALYVESFVEPSLVSLEKGAWLTNGDKAQLDALFTSTPFAQKIVAMKVWRPDGVVAYSPDRSLIGQSFPIDEKLQAALNGTVESEMSDLEDVENINERARGFDHLLEMYVPVRARGSDRIVAVAEFYQAPTELDQEVAAAQLSSWAVVAAGVVLVYLLLYGIVRQGSDTIRRQQLALQAQVAELSTLLDQNEQLRDRVRGAAERNTTLSERQLRRISSDLHDGPGQMLALAMLRLDDLGKPSVGEAAATDVRSALNDALRDMRSIAAGLRLPELASVSTADAVRRAVDDHVRRSGTHVAVEIGEVKREPQLPTKIALFRALQELLSNATRHGNGQAVSVALSGDERFVTLTVSDAGPGLDPARVGAEGHLGLAGIREQAEVLGGQFDIAPSEAGGARVVVKWPL
jgi:signal transduction histidine kinase